LQLQQQLPSTSGLQDSNLNNNRSIPCGSKPVVVGKSGGDVDMEDITDSVIVAQTREYVRKKEQMTSRRGLPET
jgi:hypothetical protein